MWTKHFRQFRYTKAVAAKSCSLIRFYMSRTLRSLYPHPPSFCSLTMHMQALTHTLSHSIMASNRVQADGAAGPAQQTVVEWIYIQSLHFFLLLWSLMNSRESKEPINVLWSIEAPSLECNPYSTGHAVFCAAWVSVCGHFLFACLCVSAGEQGPVV